MNFVSYIYIGIFVVLVIVLVLILLRRKPKRRQSIQNEYIAGLQALVSGEQDTALDKFRQVVRRDTDYIDAYILIGNLFREREAFENAIKVHRDLLVRPNLSSEQQKAILKNLALDYQLNAQPKWALSTCDKILELDKKSEWAKSFKQSLFEDMGDWQGAFEILRKNGVKTKESRSRQLSAYKVMQGLQFAALRQEHEARLRYREALKQHSKNTAAFMELIHSYVREDRQASALKELKKLVSAAPEYVDVALHTFEDFLYESGNFDELESLYKQALTSNPKNIGAYLGLAGIYEKKGEIRKAAEICQRALKYDENNLKLKAFLIRAEYKLQRFDHTAELANSIAESYLLQPIVYRCGQCGHDQSEQNLRCPQCRTWNSVERIS
jgi:lipopolysaccharide assembly protein B